MAKKDRVIWLDRGWQPVEYGFCPSRKAWKRAMKEMEIDGEDYPETDGRCTTFTKNGKTRILVTIREGAEKEHSSVEIAGILVHEATHIWQEVRSAMREREPSTEFEAYSMQAIFQELYSAFQATRG